MVQKLLNSIYVKPKKTKTPDFILFLFSAILIFIILMSGCTDVEKPVYDNPFDPLSEDFVLPHAHITNTILQNDVINVPSIIFTWESENLSSSFSYMLRGYDETYSTWEYNVFNIAYSYLDEGTYTFFVKERYDDEIVQETPDSLRFTVDVVKDCALLFRKWATNAVSGKYFSIYLDIENVSELKGLTTLIEFPVNSCSLLNIEQVNGSIGGTDGMIFIASTIDEAMSSGKIEINVTSLCSGEGFTGNSTICKLDFLSYDNGQYYININNTSSELRDIDNDTIPLDMVRGAIVNASYK